MAAGKSNFIYDTRDHEFILKEWLDMQKVFDCPKFKGYFEIDDVSAYLDQALKVAKEVVAPTNDDAETIGLKFENGKVSVPPSFHKIYHFMQENGWGVHNPDDEGTMPGTLRGACHEYFDAANPSFAPYFGLALGAGMLIYSFGTDEQKQKFLPKMFSAQWGGTMCLTEPGAGSDVGASITKAFPTETPGIYKVKGTKCFITSGDHDLTENIIHLLLARIEGAAPGTKGISLMIVPKIWVNDDGSLGEPNDVTTVAIEHKLGLQGSATAMLSFGDENKCRGYLIGNPPDAKGVADGMAKMFQLMNSARHGAGHSATAVATVAYNNAVNYAKERIQGKLITNPKGPGVPIIKHEDVRRMLLDQKAHLDAMRALIFETWYSVDLASFSDKPEEQKLASRNVQVLNPLAKAYCSDKAWDLTFEAIQTYGGYGFIEEYPVARQARECRIYSIWEGTNYIQSMDLLGRKFTLEGGQLFKSWLDDEGKFIEENKNTAGLEREFDLLQKAYAAYLDIYMGVIGYFQSNIRMVPTFSTRILHATSMLHCGNLLASQAILSLKKLADIGKDHHEYPFYEGKVQSAKYYIRNIVPYISTIRDIFKAGDTSVLDIPEESF